MEKVDKAKKELTLIREFDAPRELVFETFTTCAHVQQWWGPRTWPISACKMDFRVGGVWHYCLRGPKGEESWGKAVYHEIVRPERIVYTDYFSDKDGNTPPNMPTSVITNRFESRGRKTLLTSIGRYATVEALEQVLAMGVVAGINETFDRLDEYLEKAQKSKRVAGAKNDSAAPADTLVITHSFDASREAVWNAWTDPKQFAKWWGPHGFTNPVCELDVRPGGDILIHMKNPHDKSEYPLTGTFVEVVKPSRLVFIHRAWGNEMLNTLTLNEENGKTTLRLEVALKETNVDATQALAGAKAGFGQSFERLAALLAGNHR